MPGNDGADNFIFGCFRENYCLPDAIAGPRPQNWNTETLPYKFAPVFPEYLQFKIAKYEALVPEAELIIRFVARAVCVTVRP